MVITVSSCERSLKCPQEIVRDRRAKVPAREEPLDIAVATTDLDVRHPMVVGVVSGAEQGAAVHAVRDVASVTDRAFYLRSR